MRDFALEKYFSRWEFAARYHMTASDTESMTLDELLALASPDDREKFHKQWLGYSPTWGSAALREQISATYESVGPANVLCFAGAEEGVYTAMRVLLGAQDHALVVVPNYQAAETVPLDICAVSGVALDPERDWELDLERVEKALRPNTKLISINFPNNPTGAVPARECFDGLVEMCRRRGIWLFSDEVYRLIEREPAIRLPQAADVYERGLSLNVMSKAYGLPGLRVGWIAGQDKQVQARMERYKHYLSICNAGPSERLAVIALKARDKILQRNRQLIASNLTRLDGFFARYRKSFEWRRPDGGCVGYPRYLGPGSADALCERLVEEAGVLLLPPRLYRSELMDTPADRFRIGYGRKGIDAGLAAMSAWFDSEQYPRTD